MGKDTMTIMAESHPSIFAPWKITVVYSIIFKSNVKYEDRYYYNFS